MEMNMTGLGGFWGILLLALDIWALVSIVGSQFWVRVSRDFAPPSISNGGVFLVTGL